MYYSITALLHKMKDVNPIITLSKVSGHQEFIISLCPQYHTRLEKNSHIPFVTVVTDLCPERNKISGQLHLFFLR